MKLYKALASSLIMCVLASCSLKDSENAGVSITGNTGKISGVILASQENVLGKIAATTSDNDTFEVVLTSNKEGFEAETMWVALQDTFLFDSLPQATFSISASLNGEEFSHLDGIPLDEGQIARVTMYSGTDAPEATWKVLPKTSRVSFENVQQVGNIYIIAEQTDSVLIKSIQDRDSIDLEPGTYRAISYSDCCITEFAHFEILAGADTTITFSKMDSLNLLSDIPTEQLPGVVNEVHVGSTGISAEGYRWSGLEGSHTKVRLLYASRNEIGCDYSGDTLQASQFTAHRSQYLLDEDGYGLVFTNAIGAWAAKISEINANGFSWGLDSIVHYSTITEAMVREMDVGKATIPVKLKMIVEYGGDTILKIDYSVSRYWNNLDVVYALGAASSPNPILPSHSGLWINVLWNGFNEDGDVWRIQSKSDQELQLIDYPHTGDTLGGIMLLPDGMTQSMDADSYKTKRGYSKDGMARISVEAEAPYLRMMIGME